MCQLFCKHPLFKFFCFSIHETKLNVCSSKPKLQRKAASFIRAFPNCNSFKMKTSTKLKPHASVYLSTTNWCGNVLGCATESNEEQPRNFAVWTICTNCVPKYLSTLDSSANNYKKFRMLGLCLTRLSWDYEQENIITF